MRWIEAAVATSSGEIDTLCLELEALGVEGMCIEDEADYKRFVAQNKKYWDRVDETLDAHYAGLSRIKFYVADDAAGKARLAEIRAALGRPLTLASVDDADWENSWKQYYAPLPVGERLLIVPDWLTAEEPGRTSLRLTPGLAFGTGSHETTRLTLIALEDLAAPGKRVLDLGCGSGILAIAALLLGCASAVGCDVDPKAPEAAAANAALNGIGAERFRVCAGDVLADEGLRRGLGTGYDLVLANIVADVIVPLASFVRRFLGARGALICSGIQEQRAAEVAAALERNGFAISRRLSEGEWRAFVCR